MFVNGVPHEISDADASLLLAVKDSGTVTEGKKKRNVEIAKFELIPSEDDATPEEDVEEKEGDLVDVLSDTGDDDQTLEDDESLFDD